MNKALKTTLITAGVLIGVLVLIVVSYVIYVFAAYYRIDDNIKLEWEERSDKIMSAEGEYTALTYNVGFGAYSPDFTFFMDGGKESVAKSKEAVINNISGSIDLVKKYDPDFMLIQEVDVKATRSYKVNERVMFEKSFAEYENTFAINYDSPFLMYPLNQPHGKSLAGINTMSKYSFADSVRRSLPITDGFSKLFDLDRCYSVNKFDLDNGKSFYVYNTHLSAYGGTPEVREGQIKMLFGDMKEKIEAGNYVICGGDYNHDMTDETQDLGNENAQGNFEWAQKFPFDELPSGISFARNYIDKNIPTARNCDMEYVKGLTQVFVLDGFFVSDNIIVSSVENVDNGFQFSDHNPVVMKFKLAV